MASRVYFWATDAARETTTTIDFSASHVALTFTPNASKTYLLLWSVVIDGNDITCDPGVRLYHDTAAAVLQDIKFGALKDNSDKNALQGVAIYVAPGSPASQTFSIRFATDVVTTTTVGAQYGTIIALELGANDLYATTAAAASTTSATYATLDTVTPGAGDWIIIAAASVNVLSGPLNGRWRVQNTTDATTLIEQISTGGDGTSTPHPLWFVKSISIAGSKTYSLEHAETGSTTVNTKQRTIVALKKSDFAATYNAEQTARATITGVGSNSANDRTTLTQTTAAGDHLLLAAFIQDGSSSTSVSILGDVTEDGSALSGSLAREPIATTNVHAHGLVAIRDLTAASHTHKIRYWNETTAITGGIAEASLHLLQVVSNAYTLAMAGGSFALTGGSTGLLAARKLVQSGGSFALTGGAVTFRKGFMMVASGGSYALTGGATAFPLTRKLAMAGGSYALTGGATGLLAGRKIVATGGLFTLTGGDVALKAQRILAMAGGSFALTGGAASLRKGFTASLLGGSFSLSGGNVDFVYVPGAAVSQVFGGHYASLPRRRKWKKVDGLEALDQAIRETMRPDLIVLKDGTVVPVYAIELDDEEILLLL